MTLIKKLDQLSLTEIRIATAAISFLLTLFSITNSEIINRDGVTYLLAAEAFLTDGFLGSQEAYKWPFYPIAIATTSIATNLSLEASAHLLNIVLIVILTDSFILLYSETNQTSHSYWLPALTILAFTELNDYKPQIIRDWGFLAFSLRSFFHLSKHIRAEKKADSLFWQISIIIAALFRIEALVFLVLAPLSSITDKEKKIEKTKKIGQRYFLSAIILASAILLLPPELITTGHFDNFFYTPSNLISTFNSHAKNLAASTLNEHSKDLAKTILFSGIIVTIIIKSFSKLGFAYFAVIAGGIYINGLPKQKEYKVIYWLLAISLTIVVAFFTQLLIITGRYVLLTSILLLIVTTYYLEKWVFYLSFKKPPFLAIGFFLPISIMLIAGHTTTGAENKIYIKQAGEWINENTIESASILTNDRRIIHYAQRENVVSDPLIHERRINYIQKTIKRYDYISIRNRGDISTIEEALRNSQKHVLKKRIAQGQKYVSIFGPP